MGKRGGAGPHGASGLGAMRAHVAAPCPRPSRPGQGPGRCPQLVKNPAVSESSSFPTPERQTSPLLLYYKAEPDGLLGAAPSPPAAALIHSGGRPRR